MSELPNPVKSTTGFKATVHLKVSYRKTKQSRIVEYCFFVKIIDRFEFQPENLSIQWFQNLTVSRTYWKLAGQMKDEEASVGTAEKKDFVPVQHGRVLFEQVQSALVAVHYIYGAHIAFERLYRSFPGAGRSTIINEQDSKSCETWFTFHYCITSHFQIFKLCCV
ncbi:unnamed protein product [Nesidiocoris tenuis]|uniref:Uncharacterized protein n=1 Tax=Nesidiocoris tenuis TaxID=355587 RepID=A0A6H5G506_9HEMI|nr:unnamed protein product [Nesidiocoris tenuis]